MRAAIQAAAAIAATNPTFSQKAGRAIFVTNTYPGGYWENQGYNWFGGS